MRLLRAVRLEDELDVRIDDETERLVRASMPRSSCDPRASAMLAELIRLSSGGFRRLDELGLLEPLGGAITDRLDRVDSADYRLVAAFGEGLERYPVSNDLRRYARALLRAEPPADDPRVRFTASAARPSPGRSTRSPSSALPSSSRLVERARRRRACGAARPRRRTWPLARARGRAAAR